jgi:DNA-binding beta-propeller fold protein YncE
MARTNPARGAAALLALAGVLVAGCGREDHEGAPERRPLEVVAEVGHVGMMPGQFYLPRALASDGRWLYVADKTGRLQVIDPSSGEVAGWWRFPLIENGKPTGLKVALPPEGVGTPGERVLYVADTHYHRVLIYPLWPADATVPAAPAGALFKPPVPESSPVIMAQFGRHGNGPGEFVYTTDVAVLPDADGRHAQRIYVSEYGGNDRVSVFDGKMNFLFSFGTPGEVSPGTLTFDRPQSIALNPARGELLVTDSRNHRVARCDMDGRLLGWIGTDPAGAKFREPWCVRMLGDGTALVVEHAGARLQRIDPATGQSLETLGRSGRDVGELAEPWAAELIGDRLWVADASNHRLQAVRWRGGGR